MFKHHELISLYLNTSMQQEDNNKEIEQIKARLAKLEDKDKRMDVIVIWTVIGFIGIYALFLTCQLN